MVRNRNIPSLPIKNPQTLSQTFLDNYLGENVNDNDSGTPRNSFSTDVSDLEDFGIQVTELSSSSSLSWSEEFESETSKKLQSELERLDRIVHGTELDCSPYDVSEINEWKSFFPHLYILGHCTPANSDTSSNEEQKLTKNINKKTAFKPARNYHSLPRKPRSLEIDHYLKISSIKCSDLRQRNPPQSVSKQKTQISSEYTSLPFLPPKVQHQRRFERSKNAVTLPPIENNFRSISATPRQTSSKSMFMPLDYRQNRVKDGEGETDLMIRKSLLKLFDHIPLSNR
ncbi:uncharacterized protein [Euwallacea similis]|uniref:uncharacterized protein n=1 Tax=Euwallacea similis TaxID=1736056 RepID=UPI00344B4959